MRFCIIEEKEAITQYNGVYRQVAMYSRKVGKYHYVYAKYGSGFIRLFKDHTTSCPRVRWEETDLEIKTDPHGRLTL